MHLWDDNRAWDHLWGMATLASLSAPSALSTPVSGVASVALNPVHLRGQDALRPCRISIITMVAECRPQQHRVPGEDGGLRPS